jgi:Predicted ABC-type transport system involved in lysophospholipase L1 biosynthesis, permease component
MLKLSLRSAIAHWRRLLLTTFAIVLGVAFVIGSFVLSDSLGASINRLIDSSAGRVDLVVRPTNADILSGPQDGIRSSIAMSLAPTIATVPGVGPVTTTVVGAGQIVDGSVSDASTGGPGRGIALVTSWPQHLSLTSISLRSGRAPVGDHQVAIDTDTASTKHLVVGQRVKIATVGGVSTYTISGVFSTGGTSIFRTTLAFALARAGVLSGAPGRAARISVKVDGGADQTQVRHAIAAVLPAGVEVVTETQVLNETKTLIDQGLAIFTSVLLGFAAVTLFVSTFLIWNTFNIVVAQRTRELALLRAIGGSERQVSAAVIGEGLIVGLVASAIGIAAGIATAIALRAVLGAFGAKLPDAGVIVAARTVIVGLAVGMVVTLLSVIGPARRATSIPPIAAMREAAIAPSSSSRRRLIGGLVVLGTGLVLGATAFLGTGFDSTLRTAGTGLAAVLLFLSIASLSSHLVKPMLGQIGLVPARLGSIAADLARRNAIRAPRRVASTAAALMVGLALVGTTLVVGESIKQQLSGALTDSIHADLIVRASGVVQLDSATVHKIASTTGVASALPIGSIAAKVAGDGNDETAVSVVDTTRLARYSDPDIVEGSLPTTTTGVAISKTIADAHHLHPGSQVAISTAFGSVTRRVTGIYRRDEIAGVAIAIPGTLPTAGSTPATRYVMIDTAANTPVVESRIRTTVAALPSVKVFTATGLVADITSDLDTILAIVDALLLLAVIVAALGIANTLALSIVERTRELGLLRAIGMDRRSMRRMVRIEGLMLAIFGGLLGVGLGIVFGVATVRILPANTAILAIPTARLALLFGAACLLGLLASILPARRAGKLQILDAIVIE